MSKEAPLEKGNKIPSSVDVAKNPPPQPEVSNASVAQPARLPPPQPQPCPTEERRMASDQQWYTLHEFEEYYGIARAGRLWEEAQREEAQPEDARNLTLQLQVNNDASAVQPERACLNIKRNVFAPLLAQCRQEAHTKTWLIPETTSDARLLNMDWSNMLNVDRGANITAAVPTFY